MSLLRPAILGNGLSQRVDRSHGVKPARLGHATVVLDHFHRVALANKAIDDVRRRVPNETLGHRGRAGDPLYGIRRLLLVGQERLDDHGWARMLAGLAAGDPEGEVGATVLGQELLREAYAAADMRHARRRLVAFYRLSAMKGGERFC
jgi:hypothetical protein